MEKNTTIKTELNDLGIKIPFSAMPEMNIPEGYFASFSSELLSKIKNEDFIENLPKKMPYQLPQAYFDNFSQEISKTIQNKDSVSELIDTLPKSMPFEVPEKYFTHFPQQIEAKLGWRATKSNLFLSHKLLKKLSLAATILLFMGLAFKGLNLNSNTRDSHIVIENELAKISDNEINQYIASHQTEMDASFALDLIDESKIDIKQLETEVLENALNQISDEELLNYVL